MAPEDKSMTIMVESVGARDNRDTGERAESLHSYLQGGGREKLTRNAERFGSLKTCPGLCTSFDKATPPNTCQTVSSTGNRAFRYVSPWVPFSLKVLRRWW